MAERPSQGADHLKTIALPAADACGIGAHHQVELHRAEPQPPRRLEGVLAEPAADPLAAIVLGHHITGIGDMGTEGEGVGPQVLRSHQRCGPIHRDHHRLVLLHPSPTGFSLSDGWVVGAAGQSAGP